MIKEYGTFLQNRNVYLGIDQSYTGFAITALNDEGYTTTVYRDQQSGILRLANIQKHLKHSLDLYNVIDVAMEGYAYGSQLSNMLGELGGMVKLTLFEKGLYPAIVAPTMLKKYVTGKGKGISKSQMLLNTYKKWDIEFDDDNAADSYGLAHLIAGKGQLAYEKEIYIKLLDPKYREK